jgi:UDP-N-acetyl-alpha-D-muramoyl-L-alanyl-L-glutamate epimerase
MPTRAARFTYLGLHCSEDTLTGHYDLDGTTFTETVQFEGVGSLRDPAVVAVATLWYLVAGLSYYKAGAAPLVDLGATPIGPAGRALFTAALHDGLGEFAFRNDLPLDDVDVIGGTPVSPTPTTGDERAVLVPFGGGIDSIVTLRHLSPALDTALFIVSPASGRFAPLERAAVVMDRPIVRATRTLDPAILTPRATWFNGHVPVTAMVTLLATVAAVASGRGGVVMSNEHSASIPNTTWRGRAINHQWSKSWAAELLLADALAEVLAPGPTVASFLRDRSEPWVAKELARETALLPHFRSCNRAFRHDPAERAPAWCGTCDKCLFIALMLAPFLPRATLAGIFDGREPLLDPALAHARDTLVGLGEAAKPFECVGDPTECATTWRQLATLPEWRDEPAIASLATRLTDTPPFASLFQPQGPSRVPDHWLS